MHVDSKHVAQTSPIGKVSIVDFSTLSLMWCWVGSSEVEEETPQESKKIPSFVICEQAQPGPDAGSVMDA
jgi:hypothetical protein